VQVQVFARVALVFRYKHVKPPPARRPYWGNLFTIGAFVGGLCWGIGSLFMVTPAEFDIQLLVLLVISALIYGSLTGFGSYKPFYALLFPALTPLCVWSAFQGDEKHLAFALLGVLWIPIVAWLGYGHEQNVITSYKLRYENLELLEGVRRQKERAEEANIAKSRFLASASHDLRQPVHALGMFVGALRVHEMSAAARRLLDHVEGSVRALDGLFTALLDISRLDAGVMEEGEWKDTEVGTPQRSVISPLLANIYLHYVFDLWVEAWRKKCARGDVVVVRYADDNVLGFQYRAEADRFLAEFRERLGKFGLELHPDKTRRIEFGDLPSKTGKGEEKGSPKRSIFWDSRTSAGRTGTGTSR